MHQIDIVIPTYNYGRYLNECLSSVISQTYGDFQVLVIDNASEDNTNELMHEWVNRDSRIRYIRNENNLGSSGSIFKAYDMTSAPYWMVLCADDQLEPTFLEKVVHQGLMRHPECGFGYSLVSRLTDQGLIADMNAFVPRLATGVHSVLYHLCLTNWITLSFGVARRAAMDEMRIMERHRQKFYPGSPRSGSLGDHYQWITLASRYPAYAVDERLGIYRIHPVSETQQRGVHIKEEVVVLYDSIYYDADIFPAAARYIAKINQIGRILTNKGLAVTAFDLMQGAEMTKVTAPIARKITAALCDVLPCFYFDDLSGKLSHLTMEVPHNINLLRSILSQLPASPDPAEP